MEDSSYDMVVVGGGIHGAGIVQAGAARGYRCLLLEKDRPAAGTSSRSSKLIHGGLRYLESGQFGLVREALHERELLLRLAPDLVRLTPFLIPVYPETSRRPWQLRLGLSLYAGLGGLGANVRFGTLPRSGWDQLGGLRMDGLQAVFTYFDAQTDDAALTQAVLDSARALGAEVSYPAEFLGAERIPDGYRVRFRHPGGEHACPCKVLINAAGPWVNQVQARVLPAPPRLEVDLVQGAHLHFDQAISPSCFYIEAPRDNRAVFVLPWRGGILVGTTETRYQGKPEQVATLPTEVEYLEETLRAYFPKYSGKRLGAMAGLRVLPVGSGMPFHRSRETLLLPDDSAKPGLIAVYGGKLTTYRATAARVMRLLEASLPRRSPIARTDKLALVGGRKA
jgi:glycerol-3-phosphate dehydrogenase